MHEVMDEAPEQEETPTPEAEPAAAPAEPEAAAPAEPEAAAPAEPEAAAPAPEAAPEPGQGPAVDEAAPAEPAPAASGAAPVGAALPESEAAPAAEGEAAPAVEGEGEAAPAVEGEGEAGSAPAEGDAPAKKRRRRRKGSKVAEQWGVSATKAKEIAHKVERPKGAAPAPRRGRNRMPREKGPLPFQELRAAAEAIMRMEGERKALREAVGELADRERNELGDMVRGDGDFRQRARSISAGSLAAGKLGKALAAQQVAIADIQDLWAIMLSKEEAAERLSRVRRAKNRDRERAKRNEERASRSDRVSREDLQKAQDGRVGAQIRFVIAGEEKRDRRKKDEEPAKKTTANDLLDRLGY
jgi:hypothetical protein